MRDQETDRGRMAIIGGPSLERFMELSTEWFSSASREGDRGDPDIRSLLYGGRSLLYQEFLGWSGKMDWIERRCLYLFFIDRIPIICSLSGEGDKGEGPNMFYPQPPSVISNLNSLFLFTSTMRATTSSPLLVRERLAPLRVCSKLVDSWAIYFLSQPSYFIPLSWPLPSTRAIKREIAPKETTCVFLRYAQSGYRRYDVKSKRLDLMLRISLTLQAALLNIFCRLSACSPDLRGFQSPGTSCLFLTAFTVSFPWSDYSIRSSV
ncbi:hypothetical protein Tco_1368896 [Tanacetum coccineum]